MRIRLFHCSLASILRSRIFWVWVLLGCVPDGWAQTEDRFRLFRAADGMKESAVTAVSFSPRGNLWLKHPNASEISVFDGHAFHTLPTPGTNDYRVHESRSGQLWSLAPDGLVLYDGRQWVRHPLPDIRDEIAADPMRPIRQIPVVPADRDRVFFLLSDRLMEYDAARRQSQVIRRVTETGLGRFNEMIESRETNIWITGQNGVMRLAGPMRHVTRASEWQEFVPDEASGLRNFLKPAEDARGRLVVLATESLGEPRRVVARLEDRTWNVLPTPGELLRQVWIGFDDEIWTSTINALFRIDPEPPHAATREGTWAGQYRDVAMDASGGFWLAASEGLVRHAPALWQTPAPIRHLRSPVSAMAEDARGSLWFASAEGLVERRGARWITHPWPPALDVNLTPEDRIHAFAPANLLIGAGRVFLQFNPDAGAFRELRHPGDRELWLLGEIEKDQLCFLTRPKSDSATPPTLELFDGEKFHLWTNAPPPEIWPDAPAFCYRAANGDFWLGGGGGLVRMRDGVVERFGPAEGFSDSRARCMLEIQPGVLWCGGEQSIHAFNQQRWTSLRSRLENVHQMIKTRDGKIWAATGDGARVFFNGNWMEHETEEGLPGPALTQLLEDREGGLWAAGTRGLVRYQRAADPWPPRTGVPVVGAGSPLKTTEPIQAQFSATDRWQDTPTDRLLYSHRIDEGPWSPYAATPVLTLSRLGSGTHRLEVRAMDRNWNEDTAGQAVEFAVVLPWHQEPRLLAALGAGLVLVVFFASLAVNRHLQLKRSYAEVERIVALRTQALHRAHAELLHSQKMKALGTLAAGIAHDFNNLLSIIKGSIQIIEKNSDDPDKIRTRIGRIKTAVDQGSGIVRSMLGLSRVSGRDFVPCDLNELLHDTARLLGDRLPETVSLREEIDRTLPLVVAPRDLLQQMLINLTINASDAIAGAGRIVLRTRITDSAESGLALVPSPAPRYAVIEVADTGSGIAPDVLPRIFEPFFTTKALSARRGTGLGLSMIYELAKELGYGIMVHSQPGQGSTFSILLPAGRDHPVPSAG